MEQPGSIREAPTIIRNPEIDNIIAGYVKNPREELLAATMQRLNTVATNSGYSSVDVLHRLEEIYGQTVTALTAASARSRRGRHAAKKHMQHAAGLESLVGAYIQIESEKDRAKSLPELTVDSLKRIAEAREKSAPPDVGRVAKAVQWVMAGPDQKGWSGFVSVLKEGKPLKLAGWFGRQIAKGLGKSLQYATNTEAHEHEWAKWANLTVKVGSAVAGFALAPLAAVAAAGIAGIRLPFNKYIQTWSAGRAGSKAALRQGAVKRALGSIAEEIKQGAYNPDEYRDASSFLQSWRAKAVGGVARTHLKTPATIPV